MSPTPSVAISGLTWSLEMRTPLTTPTSAETTSTAATAGSIISGRPCMMNEASTAATLIMLATERSIDPARIAKVWPRATMPSATILCRRPITPSVSSILVSPVQSATPT